MTEHRATDPRGAGVRSRIAAAFRAAGIAALAFALASACEVTRTGAPKSSSDAPAESLLERTAWVTVKRLWFQRDGGIRARATLRIPRGAKPRSLACVVIAGGHEHGWMTAEYLHAGPGVALLSVDYPYEGPRRSISRDQIDDVVPKVWRATRDMAPLLRDAGDYVAGLREIDSTRIVIVGASLGVPFVLKAAAEDPRFSGVAVLYGAADLGAWAERNIKGIPGWTRPLVRGATRAVFHDLEPERLIPKISPRPVLIVSGRKDEMIPEDLAQRLFDAAKEPKEQVWLDTRHMNPGDTDLTWRLMRIAFDWAKRHGFVAVATRR
ncbi:MAG TPA: dienelactone hydrolase family protein [Candidatus Eisenbacteria bacterium]|nr:dienelactone hydrolase family protein [Candidatus Eisenbacteria bacterium]